MTLLITRPLPEALITAKVFEARGFKILIAPLAELSPLDNAFDTTGYEAVIFTSSRAIRPCNLPVYQLKTNAEELATRINASPYTRFLWGAGEERAVDLKALCPVKTIDITLLYRMTPLSPKIDTTNLTGILHYSAIQAVRLFTFNSDEKLHSLPNFCLSKRIEQALPKGLIKMSAKKPSEESLVTLVETELKPDIIPEITPEKVKPHNSGTIKLALTAIIAALFGACGAFATFTYLQEPVINISPLVARLDSLENKYVNPDLAPLLKRIDELEKKSSQTSPNLASANILPDLTPLTRDIAQLKERAKTDAQPVDLNPLEKRITSLEQNQTIVQKLIEKHKRDLDLTAQIQAVKAPTSATLLKAIPTLKQVTAKEDNAVMSGLKSFIKVTKTGDIGIKDLEKALLAGDLKATNIAWASLPEDFRQVNATFEAQLKSAIAGELTINDLKTKLLKE